MLINNGNKEVIEFYVARTENKAQNYTHSLCSVNNFKSFSLYLYGYTFLQSNGLLKSLV